MNDVLQSLRLMQERKEEEESLGFWKNHSVFQATYKLVAYRGTAEALTLLYLYERAAGIPFRVEVQTLIQLKVRVETICERTGLGRWAVSQAIATLEAAGCIRVQNRTAQSKVSGRRLIHIYLLLHPQTQEPLTATPGQFGICHSNGFDRPYITCPRETREVLKEMRPAGRAVYIAALALASKRMQTQVGVKRSDFRTESLLGKNAFNRGLLECRRRKLLSYQRSVLTLNDPRTGTVSVRSAREFVTHENPKWKFNLDSVTPAQWKHVCEKLLKREVNVGGDGWTYSRWSACPLCKTQHGFALNFERSQYVCHNRAGCKSPNGRLAQFVQRMLRARHMAEAKNYIRQCISEMEQKQATAA